MKRNTKISIVVGAAVVSLALTIFGMATTGIPQVLSFVCIGLMWFGICCVFLYQSDFAHRHYESSVADLRGRPDQKYA